MTFGGIDLYPTLADKAAALGFSLIMNHPFVDGNKRVGHASMETFLALNGFELIASVDDAEVVILQVAAGQISQQDFTSWVQQHLQPIP
jgi:death-on-curing protein